MNKKNYKTAVDNIKFSEDLNTKTLDYLASNASQPLEKTAVKKIKNKKFYGAFAAAAAMVLMIGIPMFTGSSDFQLPNSVGKVSVKYIDKAPLVSSEPALVWLTEEELFHKRDTDIFMGRIEDIKNIRMDFNGSTVYRAIAKINIDKVYRGDTTAGETVSVLLPCSIDTDVKVEDTEVISSMRVGMTGIFMPLKYDETSYREENGAKIYLQDIAQYGLLDGERYAFLNSGKELIFYKHAYESIKSATSLEEIERYVIRMIE